MHLLSLKLLHPTVLEGHLQENTLFDLGVKVTQNASQYPLHHVNYVPAKFEVAMFRHLQENTLFDLSMAFTLGSTVGILLRKLYEKPADLDLQCFQKG